MICDKLELCRTTPQYKYAHCEDCCNVETSSKVVRRERKSQYTLINPNHIKITVFHVDNGIIKNEKNCRKCDYIYDINTSSTMAVIYIELKGKHLLDALEQIENTVNLLDNVFNNAQRFARIICSRVPSINNDPKGIKIKKYLQKMGIQLKINEKVIEETLDSLIK